MGGVDAELFETVSSLDLLNLIYQKELKTIFSYACIYVTGSAKTLHVRVQILTYFQNFKIT